MKTRKTGLESPLKTIENGCVAPCHALPKTRCPREWRPTILNSFMQDKFLPSALERCPDPSNALVFIDENSVTLEDGYCAIQVDARIWQNDPSARHSRGANITFADGHAQIFKWLEPLTGRHGSDAPAQKPTNRDFDRLAPTIATKQ